MIAYSQHTCMTAQEFEARVVDWVRRQPDVVALVQLGSRDQPGLEVDGWSDWDYHLIVHDPIRYRNLELLEAIAPCWSAHVEQTARGVT